MFAKVKPNTQIIGQNIIYFNQVASTNEFALELIKQNLAENGSVVVAEFQSKGRGQYGKSWISEPFENLMFSIVLRFVTNSNTDPFIINKITTVTMHQVVAQILPNHSVKIKWPNDILVNSKKICGILVENNFSGSSLNYSVVGIGLNVNQHYEHITSLNATSLAGAAGLEFDREALLKQILEQFESVFQLFSDNKVSEINNQFNESLFGFDTFGAFDIEGKIEMGKIIGCDAYGRLEVEIDSEIKTFQHGSIKQFIS